MTHHRDGLSSERLSPADVAAIDALRVAVRDAVVTELSRCDRERLATIKILAALRSETVRKAAGMILMSATAVEVLA